MQVITVEPRYNEVLWDWQNLFAITRFRYIIVCLNPWVGKMSQIPYYDFLPERARLLPTRDFVRWS